MRLKKEALNHLSAAFREFDRLLSWLPLRYFRVIHSVRNLPNQKKTIGPQPLISWSPSCESMALRSGAALPLALSCSESWMCCRLLGFLERGLRTAACRRRRAMSNTSAGGSRSRSLHTHTQFQISLSETLIVVCFFVLI